MKCFLRFLLLSLLFISCQSSRLPKKPLPNPEELKISYELAQGQMTIEIQNLLYSPVRLNLSPVDSLPGKEIPWKEVLLKAREKVRLQEKWFGAKPEIKFTARFGDPSLPVKNAPVEFPVSRKKEIRILQGYNGTFSHDHDFSRYAIDFALPEGDSLYAATSGVVVEAVEGYRYGGNDKRWLNYGNKILIYDDESNRYFLYSHLVHKGSFVEAGDFVAAGEPIGLSGNTGFSSRPHLHFNVLVPGDSPSGLISVSVEFVEGYSGSEFRKNRTLPKEK